MDPASVWARVKARVRTHPRLTNALRRLRALGSSEAPWVPPGHFYSPLPSASDLRARETAIWGVIPSALPGIDLNATGQIGLLEQLKPYYSDFEDVALTQTTNWRYSPHNDFMPFADAFFLHALMRALKPRRIIEVGSGYSTCVMLDTNERFLDRPVALTCIEPHPERLFGLLRPDDRARMEVIGTPVQLVSVDHFSALEAGDMLFIDSTHTVKTGGDVNYLFFEALPRLAPGVYVHIHDIWYPFEYPREWVFEGRAWNEAYLVRAFLQHNHAFSIMLSSHYLALTQAELLARDFPLCLRMSGCSLWLTRM